MVVVSLLYLHFGVLAVVFFYVVSLKKQVCVCRAKPAIPPRGARW